MSSYETLSEDEQRLIHDFAREIKPSDLYMPWRKARIYQHLYVAETLDAQTRLGKVIVLDLTTQPAWTMQEEFQGGWGEEDPTAPTAIERKAFQIAQKWLKWSDEKTIIDALMKGAFSKDPADLLKRAAVQKEVKRELNWDLNHWR